MLYVVPSMILSPDVNAQPSDPLPPACIAPGVPEPAYVADAFNQPLEDVSSISVFGAAIKNLKLYLLV